MIETIKYLSQNISDPVSFGSLFIATAIFLNIISLIVLFISVLSWYKRTGKLPTNIGSLINDKFFVSLLVYISFFYSAFCISGLAIKFIAQIIN